MSFLSNFVLSSFKMFQDTKILFGWTHSKKGSQTLQSSCNPYYTPLQQEGILIDCKPPTCWQMSWVQVNKFEHISWAILYGEAQVEQVWICLGVGWSPVWGPYEQTGRHDWKYYLFATLLSGGKNPSMTRT